MSVSPINTSAPSQTPTPAAAKPAAPAAPAQAAQQVSAAKAALEEATETRAQTVKEAAGGDRQAQRVLQKQSAAAVHLTTGGKINTKA